MPTGIEWILGGGMMEDGLEERKGNDGGLRWGNRREGLGEVKERRERRGKKGREEKEGKG